MVNQQVTLLSFNNGTSETACDITLKLDNYLNQNKTGFLVWFIGLKKVYKKVYFDISVSIKDIQVIYYIKQELGKVMIKDQGLPWFTWAGGVQGYRNCLFFYYRVFSLLMVIFAQLIKNNLKID